MSARDYTSILNQGVTAGGSFAVTSIPKHKAVFLSNHSGSTGAVVTVKTMKPDGTAATGDVVIGLAAGGNAILPFRVYSVVSVTTSTVNVSFLM
jgi:hypothetical protein